VLQYLSRERRVLLNPDGFLPIIVAVRESG